MDKLTFSLDEVIRALYLAALGREPDRVGYQRYSDFLHAHPKSLQQVATQIWQSDEHQGTFHDHSQFGEFRTILGHYLSKAAHLQLIVDVGAKGRHGSNSYDLLKLFGWKGLLIEANPALKDVIEREFAGADFELEICAIAAEEGTSTLFLGVNDGVSSLKRGVTAAWGEIKGQVTVKIRRLQHVLTEKNIPFDFDILSLDIEGLDVDVLNDLIMNSLFRPRLIILETSFDFRVRSLDDVANLSDRVKQIYRIGYQTQANMLLLLN